MARVEEMTRQLEEVRRGRELRQGPQGDTHRELEKLRRELMVSGERGEGKIRWELMRGIDGSWRLAVSEEGGR